MKYCNTVYRKEAEVKKPKAKPAGASTTEGGAEGDVAVEKDEGDGDEVCTNLEDFILKYFNKRSSTNRNYANNALNLIEEIDVPTVCIYINICLCLCGCKN